LYKKGFMATYYSMQEVMEKLRKTEQEVQSLVKQGQLRQYLDTGKPVFKVEDVDNLAQEIVGLDISSVGINLDEGTDLDLQLEESGEIQLVPDETPDTPAAKDEIDLSKPLTPESEGGFGLSQMGDLSMADTNVGTVGINILSGTDDAYKLTEDSKAETQADEVQLEEASAEEIESLDADSNLESFGSGSGLLDLSLQADDTSLGAVLDDILPSGAEGAPAGGAEMPADEGAIGLMDEDENLMAPQADSERAAGGLAAEPMAPVMAAPAAMAVGGPMVAVMPVDPKTNIYGLAMFLPLAAMILAAIVMTSAIQGVVPSVVKSLIETRIADISLIWYIVGGLAILVLLILLFAALLGGGNGGSGTPKPAKVKKEKAPKKEKPAKKRK
jgi:hypothetical protein